MFDSEKTLTVYDLRSLDKISGMISEVYDEIEVFINVNPQLSRSDILALKELDRDAGVLWSSVRRLCSVLRNRFYNPDFEGELVERTPSSAAEFEFEGGDF